MTLVWNVTLFALISTLILDIVPIIMKGKFNQWWLHNSINVNKTKTSNHWAQKRHKESLNIRKGHPEAGIRRRIEIIMTKRTKNDLQNITLKTKDRATRTPLKTARTKHNLAPCLGEAHEKLPSILGVKTVNGIRTSDNNRLIHGLFHIVLVISSRLWYRPRGTISVEGWWQGQYEKGHVLIYLSHFLTGQITWYFPSQEDRKHVIALIKCYCPEGK